MSQATDDLIASITHLFLQLDREKAGYLATIEALTLACDVQAEQIAELRAAADQAIANLRGMKALNDDPTIEQIIDVTADLLGAALGGTL